jgi:integrase
MSRRANGEGSVYQRKDGRWVGSAYASDGQGKVARRTVYGRTRKEASDKLATMLARATNGLPAVEASTKVGAYLEQWLEDVVQPQVRRRTYEAYRTCVERHITPALGKKQLRNLTPVDIRTLLNSKHSSGLSPLTVKYIHSVLRSALAQAMRDGLVHRNVATLVRPPRAPRREAAYLTPVEARALLDTAKSDRLSAFWVVALTLGLRRGELLGLRWQSVDLDRGVLRVRESVQRVRGAGLVVEETKSARSDRTIPLPKMTREALRQHRERQAVERSAAGQRWMEHDLVFPSPIGTPMDPRNLNREFGNLLGRARVGVRIKVNKSGDEELAPRIRLHDLRHTCATFLVAQGVPLRAVMEILGHSGIAITSDTYSHVLPTLLSDAADKMNDLLDEDREDDG